MALFRQGRVLVENEPDALKDMPSGGVPAAYQPLAEDEFMRTVFENPDVIQRAGGLPALDNWLLKTRTCQWPHASWHDGNMTILRHEPGAIRLCWSCDNELREHCTEQLAGIARTNLIAWLIDTVRSSLRFDESHVLTLPELCWWMVQHNLAEAIPEEIARRALQLPEEIHRPVMRECDISPSVPAKELVAKKVSPLIILEVDPETPESFMRKPKRRRWVCEKYTRWVKKQPCMCCQQQADDPHHIIGYGLGGMGTKAHDIFTIPLCRRHHDELHHDVASFECRYGSQLELLFRFVDRAIAMGVLA
jgi:hypothetical protein